MNRAAKALLVSLVALLPAASRAKGLPPNYAELKLGGYFPMAHDVSGYDAGFAGELAIGRSLDRGFAFEGSLGSYQTKGTLPGGVDRKLRITPLALSLKGTAPFGQFEPYAMAGIGVYFVHDELGAAALGTSGRTTSSSTNLGLHLGIGADYFTSSGLFLGLEGKYLFLKATTFGTHTRLDGAVVGAHLGFRF
jgi:opacity protein-like surface antigen